MKKMFIHWDAEGDFLELRFGKPTKSYYEEIKEDFFERRDEKTDKLKGYVFFNIQKRRIKIPRDIVVNIPVEKGVAAL